MTSILFSLSLLGCIPKTITPESLYKTIDIPLYRSSDQGQRLFVELELPVVGTQYFMVDTGAAVSAIRLDLAEEMGYPVVRKSGYLTGVSGTIPWVESKVPDVSMGPVELGNVNFAVGVEGVPERAGLVPIAGVIGNNVWSQFLVDIDYGAELLRLHPSFEFSASSSSMRFDGQNILAGVQLRHDEDTVVVTANIDTGSSGLILNALHIPTLRKQALNSKEAILGVGADMNNLQDYVVDTQVLEIDQTTVGGHSVETPISAILLAPANPDFMSLVGYEVFENNRLIIDFANNRLEVRPSSIDLPPRNLHKEYLRAIQWGTEEADQMTEVQLHFFLDQRSTGLRKLKRLFEKYDNPEYSIALANYYFDLGEIHTAIGYLARLTTGELMEQGYIQALTLAYLYTEQYEQAARLIAVMEKAKSNDVWWLKSMTALLKEDIPTAKRELFNSNQVANPNDFLVFQAILKHQSQDLSGTVSLLRKDIHLNPLGNHSLWFLAKVAMGTPYEDLAKTSILEKMDLEHSTRGSLDFLAAALWEIGDRDAALRIAQTGKKRDCRNGESDLRSNCNAWYDALTHQNLDQQINIMTEIVASNPGRSDYADTLAVLHRAKGNDKKAMALSKKALIFGGADPYMMWQHFVQGPIPVVSTETPIEPTDASSESAPEVDVDPTTESSEKPNE